MYWNTVKDQEKIAYILFTDVVISFSYLYLIYCSQVWGNNYPAVLYTLLLVLASLVRIITCNPFRSHTEPLMYANKVLSLNSSNTFLMCIFMNQYIHHQEVPELVLSLFQTNDDIHDHNTFQSEQL